jgi:hypothetical protein
MSAEAVEAVLSEPGSDGPTAVRGDGEMLDDCACTVLSTRRVGSLLAQHLAGVTGALARF